MTYEIKSVLRVVLPLLAAVVLGAFPHNASGAFLSEVSIRSFNVDTFPDQADGGFDVPSVELSDHGTQVRPEYTREFSALAHAAAATGRAGRRSATSCTRTISNRR